MRREQYNHKHPELPKGVHLEIPEHHEPFHASRWFVGGFMSPTLVVLYTIFWVFMAYWLIGWRTRDWEYGVVPYVPAESHFTSQAPPGGPIPKQVQLPIRTAGGPGAKR